MLFQRAMPTSRASVPPLRRASRLALHVAPVLALALAGAGCPRSDESLNPSRRYETEGPNQGAYAISRQVAALLRTQEELLWKNWVEGAPLDLPATYRGKESLFSAESLRLVRSARQSASNSLDARAWSHLNAYLLGEAIGRALSEEDLAIANLEGSLTFTSAGTEYAYRELPRLLANERTAAKRSTLYAAATPAAERLSASLRRREEKLRTLLPTLGYDSWSAYAEATALLRLQPLASLAEDVLALSDGAYKTLLAERAARELASAEPKPKKCDLPRLFPSPSLDAVFPKEQVRARADATLRGLGFELSGFKGLTLDVRELPQKNPRPLAVAVSIPNDVRVSVRPAGGVRAQGNLFHELGHALYSLHVRQERFELAKLGGSGQAEAYASLFENLLGDSAWLEDKAGLSSELQGQHLAQWRAQRLYALRRAAGRFLFQVKAASAEPAEHAELYRTIMGRALGVPLGPDDLARYRVEADDFFKTADELQGWALAGQLAKALREKYGSAWWKQRDAGKFLESLWARGSALSVEELSLQLSTSGLRAEPLLGQLGALTPRS